MPPATRQMVVTEAQPTALRARPLLGGAGHMNADLAVAAVFEVELDLGDGPRGFDAEDSLVEVFVSHLQGEPWSLAAAFPPRGAARRPPSPCSFRSGAVPPVAIAQLDHGRTRGSRPAEQPNQ